MRLGRSISLLLALLALSFAALRVDAAEATITEFSTGLTAENLPTEMVAGPDGNIWFVTEDFGGTEPAVGRITPAGAITEFRDGLAGAPAGIVPGPDGNLWFGISGSPPAIGWITPAGEITRFANLATRTQPQDLTIGPGGRVWFVSSSGSRPGLGYARTNGEIFQAFLPTWPSGIVAGSDGNMWFTYGEGPTAAIGKLESVDGPGGTTISYFRDGLDEGSRPRQIILGPDGNLWFVDSGEGKIGRVTPSGNITMFGDDLSWVEEILSGPDGNVWFTQSHGAQRISPDGSLAHFPFPGYEEGRRLRGLTVGPEGNLWFASSFYDQDGNGGIGRITPAGQVEEYNVGLNPGTEPAEIILGPDGNLWFTDRGEPAAIGRVTPTGNSFIPPWYRPPAPQPPSAGFPPHQLPPVASWVYPADRRVRVGVKGRATIKLRCSGTMPCVGDLEILGWKKSWRAGRTIGASPFSIPAGSTKRIVVRVNRVAQGLLRTPARQRTAWVEIQLRGAFVPPTHTVKLVKRG
jgi:streptogramin lyase